MGQLGRSKLNTPTSKPTSPKHSETCHFPASVMPQLTSRDGTKHGYTLNPVMASGVCETETDFVYACLISDILKCAF